MNRPSKSEPQPYISRGWADDRLSRARSLILVVGHRILRRIESVELDEGWFLKHFQEGEAKFYIEHVRRGVLLTASDPDAILLFAGGQTDFQAGP